MKEKELREVVDLVLEEMRKYVNSQDTSARYCYKKFGTDSEEYKRANSWRCACDSFYCYMENQLTK